MSDSNMAPSTDPTDELNQVMKEALFKLQKLVDNHPSQNLLTIVRVFLLGVISTAIDLVDIHLPGSAPLLFADIEAAAKVGGISAIQQIQTMNYSVSNIADDDFETAMNYLGQQLTTTLFKGFHELPMPLRNPEMLLRAIETLLANLLIQKFDRSHEVLDSLCEHVHMALDHLQNSKH